MKLNALNYSSSDVTVYSDNTTDECQNRVIGAVLATSFLELMFIGVTASFFQAWANMQRLSRQGERTLQVVPIGITLQEGKMIELIRYHDSQVWFDYGNGLKKTSWIGREDTILVYDHNGNQQVDGGLEIELTRWSPGARTDFEALLSAFDVDANRVFNGNDSQFGFFYLWQDKNQNGISDNNELVSLRQAGLESISFEKIVPVYGEMREEYGVLNMADVIWEDGRVTHAVDLIFTHE